MRTRKGENCNMLINYPDEGMSNNVLAYLKLKVELSVTKEACVPFFYFYFFFFAPFDETIFFLNCNFE